MAAHFFKVGCGVGGEGGFDYVAAFDVVFGGGFDIFERENLFAGLDEAFGEKKTSGEFEVVARSAHGDAERLVADADFVSESAADSDRLFAKFEAGALIGPADHEERRLCRPGSLVRCHDDSTCKQPVPAPGGSVFRTSARGFVPTS